MKRTIKAADLFAPLPTEAPERPEYNESIKAIIDRLAETGGTLEETSRNPITNTHETKERRVCMQKDLCEALFISPYKLRKLTAAGTFHPLKIGGYVFYMLDEVEAYLRERYDPTSAPKTKMIKISVELPEETARALEIQAIMGESMSVNKLVGLMIAEYMKSIRQRPGIPLKMDLTPAEFKAMFEEARASVEARERAEKGRENNE